MLAWRGFRQNTVANGHSSNCTAEAGPQAAAKAVRGVVMWPRR
jgi:hypothetical protein